MRADRRSIRKPISNRVPSDTSQVYTGPLNTAPSSTSTKIRQEAAKEIATPMIVTQCAPERPILLPPRPATIAPASGATPPPPSPPPPPTPPLHPPPPV